MITDLNTSLPWNRGGGLMVNTISLYSDDPSLRSVVNKICAPPPAPSSNLIKLLNLRSRTVSVAVAVATYLLLSTMSIVKLCKNGPRTSGRSL